MVTVDDSTTAAALLNGLVDRRARERTSDVVPGDFPARLCRWANRPPPVHGPASRSRPAKFGQENISWYQEINYILGYTGSRLMVD
ncbi:hypothetical protein E2C00_19250 [Streptomyces sp. WAC05374]|uniref:hypothetical protein n=1 Tax=Streptomyces sp. WAC05374 TaxID=2487420 RepID=UPI000F870D60|nr:hypothetical protein [Streptomyces sp. WAC05374]RST17702.1 hypothetical protein EF905_08495 [Streptomyces sp. WAC05374]TDF52703.1 hypothetical protein E2C02_20720 [Streptomyces sp. WAC05374]TDF54122.1 hypothetical protein E2C00_19250 [Streptomyces sp. WAC05374]